MFFNTPSHRGSVYLVTIITVAAIASMVLIGVRIRSAANEQSALVELMAEGNNGVLDAAEYALQHISDDADWASTAKTGTIFPQVKIGSTNYTGTVTDAETDTLPTDTTTRFKLKLSAESNAIRSSAELEVYNNVSSATYAEYIKSIGADWYWPLSESTGAVYAEDHLLNYEGVYLDPSIVGTATNNQGANVPLFNDNNDQMQVDWASRFSKPDGSFSLWMKSTQQTPFVSYGIIGGRFSASGPPNIMLTIYNGGLYGYIDDDGVYTSSNVASSASGIVKVNTWHHVVFTWGPSGLTVYLDGREVARNASNRSEFDSSGRGPISFGAAYIKPFMTVSEVGFKGSIAHVAYYAAHQLPAKTVEELAAVIPDLPSGVTIVENTWVKVIE